MQKTVTPNGRLTRRRMAFSPSRSATSIRLINPGTGTSEAVTITQDGNVISTSSAASGSFDFNSYGLGVFAINASATDADNDRPNDSLSNSGARSVTVSDDDTTGPTIVLGGSQGSENDGQKQHFTWNVTDASGPFFTVVTETEVGSLGEWEQLIHKVFAVGD